MKLEPLSRPIPDRYGTVPIFISNRLSVSIGTYFFQHDFRKRGWNALILKVIRGVSDSYRPLQKPNGNTSGTIIGYDFEFK